MAHADGANGLPRAMSALQNAVSPMINPASVANAHNQHHQGVVLQLTDDAVIPHAVAPQFSQTAFQWFAELARVIERRHSVSEIVADPSGLLPAELA